MLWPWLFVFLVWSTVVLLIALFLDLKETAYWAGICLFIVLIAICLYGSWWFLAYFQAWGFRLQ